MENLTQQLNQVETKLEELLAEIQSDDSLYFAKQYYALYKELNLLRQYVRDADFRDAHRPKQDTKVNDVRVTEPVKANLTEKDLEGNYVNHNYSKLQYYYHFVKVAIADGATVTLVRDFNNYPSLQIDNYFDINGLRVKPSTDGDQ